MLPKILIGVAATIVVAVGSLEAYEQWQNYRFARDAPLAARLPNNFREANDEFRKRIRDRFPSGTSQSELVDNLASEGFQLEQGYARAAADASDVQPKPFRHMHLTKMADVITDICRRDWYVSWETDPNNRLSAVDAKYSVICP